MSDRSLIETRSEYEECLEASLMHFSLAERCLAPEGKAYHIWCANHFATLAQNIQDTHP